MRRRVSKAPPAAFYSCPALSCVPRSKRRSLLQAILKSHKYIRVAPSRHPWLYGFRIACDKPLVCQRQVDFSSRRGGPRVRPVCVWRKQMTTNTDISGTQIFTTFSISPVIAYSFICLILLSLLVWRLRCIIKTDKLVFIRKMMLNKLNWKIYFIAKFFKNSEIKNGIKKDI